MTAIILSLFSCLLFDMWNNSYKMDDDAYRQAVWEHLHENLDNEFEGRLDKRDYSFGIQTDIARYTDIRVQVLSVKISRSVKYISQIIHEACRKRDNDLCKVSESNQSVKSARSSSLRKRSGHWSYVLRKILI